MKFSIRDLVLMTIICILLVMWIRAEYKDTRTLQALRLWRQRVGALERLLRHDGWKLRYDTGGVTGEKDGSHAWVSGYVFEPEGSDELSEEFKWKTTTRGNTFRVEEIKP